MIGTSLLNLFQLHEEAFELGRVSIRIEDRRRKLIREVFRSLVFVLGDAAITPVNGYADLIGLFSINHHRLDAICDHRFRYIFRTGTRHLDLVTACNSPFTCELGWDLDEWFRDQLYY